MTFYWCSTVKVVDVFDNYATCIKLVRIPGPLTAAIHRWLLMYLEHALASMSPSHRITQAGAARPHRYARPLFPVPSLLTDSTAVYAAPACS